MSRWKARERTRPKVGCAVSSVLDPRSLARPLSSTRSNSLLLSGTTSSLDCHAERLFPAFLPLSLAPHSLQNKRQRCIRYLLHCCCITSPKAMFPSGKHLGEAHVCGSAGQRAWSHLLQVRRELGVVSRDSWGGSALPQVSHHAGMLSGPSQHSQRGRCGCARLPEAGNRRDTSSSTFCWPKQIQEGRETFTVMWERARGQER